MTTDPTAEIRNDHDAFGHIVYENWLGNEVFEIVERSDGYIGASNNPRWYFSGFADWPSHEQEGLKHLVPGRVLDGGCGVGRVALYLQEQEYEVTAVDTSPLAIEVCRQRGVLDARVADIHHLPIELGWYSNIILYGNNWGLMASFATARRVLAAFRRITTPSARIIASSSTPYNTDDPVHLAYQAHNRARGRMSGQLKLRVRYQLHTSRWFDYLLVSKDEMTKILDGTGWHVREWIDAPGGKYVAVIEKE